jgi:hypothetical protein
MLITNKLIESIKYEKQVCKNTVSPITPFGSGRICSNRLWTGHER